MKVESLESYVLGKERKLAESKKLCETVIETHNVTEGELARVNKYLSMIKGTSSTLDLILND